MKKPKGPPPPFGGRKNDFTPAEVTALRQVSLDAEKRIYACKGDMDESCNFCDTWIWFDDRRIYVAVGNEEIKPSKNRKKRLDPKITIEETHVFENAQIDRVRCDLDALARCKPVYEELPGWQCDTSHVTDYAELPENAKKYVNRILDLVGGKLGVLSVGPARETTLRIGV